MYAFIGVVCLSLTFNVAGQEFYDISDVTPLKSPFHNRTGMIPLIITIITGMIIV